MGFISLIFLSMIFIFIISMIKSIIRKIIITIKNIIKSIYSLLTISKSVKISNLKNISDVESLLPKDFKKIQLGIIGTGDISKTHINNLKSLSNIFHGTNMAKSMKRQSSY